MRTYYLFKIHINIILPPTPQTDLHQIHQYELSEPLLRWSALICRRYHSRLDRIFNALWLSSVPLEPYVFKLWYAYPWDAHNPTLSAFLLRRRFLFFRLLPFLLICIFSFFLMICTLLIVSMWLKQRSMKLVERIRHIGNENFIQNLVEKCQGENYLEYWSVEENNIKIYFR